LFGAVAVLVFVYVGRRAAGKPAPFQLVLRLADGKGGDHEDDQTFEALHARFQQHMRVLIFFAAWCILLVLCWPIALLALVLAPLIWLITLPLRLVAICVHAAFALLRAVLLLPARLLGYRPAR
jgi:hypothetical protein